MFPRELGLRVVLAANTGLGNLIRCLGMKRYWGEMGHFNNKFLFTSPSIGFLLKKLISQLTLLSLFFHFMSFKTYLKFIFTIVDSKILIHTNYLQEKYT